MKKTIKKQFAFTLIELLIVIAIIGILSALIIVGMNNATQKATIAKAQVFSNSLRNSLMSGLFAEYKLDGNASDTWGTHTAGTISGASSYASCIQNTCYSFDSDDDYIELADVADLRMITGGTISVWIYPKSYGEGTLGRIIDKSSSGDSGLGGYTFRNSSLNRLLFVINDGTNTLTQQNVITYNQWQLVTTTFNDSGRKIYVNGIDKTASGGNETDLPPDSTGIVVRIGNSAYGTTRTFDGYIDDVQIYNQVIPTSQIQQNYYAGLNKLFANRGVEISEYQQCLTELSNNYAQQ
ncbi:MAG: LamG-like jellyroll fold domain-containing protein [Candidatus Paceibacterota bacterium]